MGGREQKKRVDTAGSVGGGLNEAFAGLSAAGLPAGPERAPVEESVAPAEVRGRVVLRREKAHRGGKTVVVVSGFDPEVKEAMIEELARALRKACGCGGTVEGREMVVQGDQAERVAGFFRERGFRVAGVGAEQRRA